MKLRILLVLLVGIMSGQVFAQDSVVAKINGLSLVSDRFFLDSSHIPPIVNVGANYAAVIPFCFMPNKDSSTLIFGDNHSWKGEGLNGTRIAVRELHRNGVNTMVKPQIWVGHGVFTGEIEMNNEDNWIQFERNYTAYIRSFAVMAEEENVSLLCIGTEMGRVVAMRPELFSRLIKEIRSVYSGKLTYAENWDCFEKVEFWNKLDYIGVDAYFPISTARNPSVEDLKHGWDKYLSRFDSLSAQLDRKILFTEFGYRSMEKCALTPWEYKGVGKPKIDEKCQARALKALFESVWDQDYFAGGFLWKWYPKHDQAGGKKDSMFTVQNKEAEDVVRKRYTVGGGS